MFSKLLYWKRRNKGLRGQGDSLDSVVKVHESDVKIRIVKGKIIPLNHETRRRLSIQDRVKKPKTKEAPIEWSSMSNHDRHKLRQAKRQAKLK